jgi:hypothetical protein
MKKRYSEETDHGFLRDGEAGIAVKDLCLSLVAALTGGLRCGSRTDIGATLQNV